MPARERLEVIGVKVERAKEHLRTLETEVRSYLASTPYVIGTRRDPESRRLIYFLVSVRPTPLKISAMLGDTIHNLRSALDHVAYQLVSVGMGKAPSVTCTFPATIEQGTLGSGDIRARRPKPLRHLMHSLPTRVATTLSGSCTNLTT